MIEVRPPAEVQARPESSPGAAPDGAQGSTVAQLRVFRGEPGAPSRYDAFELPVEEGMVVLDPLHWVQANGAPDLAVRWNCKAAKCGSFGAHVNGQPRLTCKTGLSRVDLAQPVVPDPMQ